MVPRLLLLALLLCAPHAARAGLAPPQPDYLRLADPFAAFPTRFSSAPGAQPGDVVHTLTNGLATRSFLQRGGGFATVELLLEAGDGTHFTRAVAPEARVFLGGGPAQGVDVGGFVGQTQFLQYFPDETTLSPNPLAMVFSNLSTSAVVLNYNFTPRWGVPAASWPPRGVHLAVEFAPPPDPGPDAFTQLNNTAVNCDGTACLTGWFSCNNASVPGQCSFPRATAVGLCTAWPACLAVTCNPGRDDCQARGTLDQITGSSFTSFVRGGFFPSPDLRVTVHTEMYDGLPAFSRWLTVGLAAGAAAAQAPVIDQASMDLLHVPFNLRNRLHAETAYMPALGIRNSMEDAGWYPASGSYNANFSCLTSPPVNLWTYDEDLMGPWGQDSSWEYWYDEGMNETLLDVRFPFGPGLNISAGPLETFRVYTILHDDDDADRQGLGRRRMLRAVAPQVEMDISPFYMVGGDSNSIRAGADAASALGFRALHTQTDPFDMSPAHIAQVKADVAYVHSKGLVAAFYVLLQNPPGLTEADEVIDPTTGQGEGIACFATAFHRSFRAGIEAFVQATGFDFIDTDGPYEQAPCGSTTHEHVGLVDSQFAQWRANVGWYRTLPSAENPLSSEGSGMMISCPDPYELAAGSWNQPIGYTDRWGTVGEPWTWLLLGRTYIFDGTVHKPPTNGGVCLDLDRMGGMASPDELRLYNTTLAVFLGVAGRCFQSGALWQGDASKALVEGWMAVFNRFRGVLNGDVIHLKKPSGRSWDGVMHVLPSAAAGSPRGFAIFFNPSTTAAADFSTALPVYYCGFAAGAAVHVEWSDGSTEDLQQDAFFSVALRRTIEAKGFAWAALS